MSRAKAVIIAGGLGTRLRPLTYDMPKPIVSVVNRPFIVHQIELFKQHGITDIILSLHYMSEAIKHILGNGSEYGVKLYYCVEKDPLGTAGAVKNAEEFFGDEPLVVFNGDILTDINISKVLDFHISRKSKVTLTLTSVDDPTAYGLVLTDKERKIKQFIEKPTWSMLEGVDCREINAGLYVLAPSIFNDVPKNKLYMFEHDLFPKLLCEGAAIYGFLSDRYWMDIGNTEKYIRAHEDILRGEVSVRIFGTRHQEGYWLGENVSFGEAVKIFGSVLIGDRVKLNSGVALKDYTVIGEKVEIGEHSTLERCIVWRGAHIGKNVKMSNCVVGFDCKIEDDCKLNGAVLASKSLIKKGSIINV
ncbi:hypothetical protein A2526_02640 [candidate division WOR-1 bacterium RIFOXYD2_FULL_36_8]|uniref:Uncharacterized protein n=1 Tax=candidate division WOR-1 bacterium RIFOXYB2_FULL_36_35 TaxID=1802578 RepID=A0A1F4S3P5_UNCSA|nr:MAG: hypothetical protein A2230_08935 [candidate division WOR-1 bacterium RIFOXYA2_FULL_36_21]OGC14997.1 MAG: hypothetical protein A2290_01575 [candidate division WOR-1 bacterium RIFOXYB2_FULL_36_35]OGC38691.1 MAG: hypothetical protein A2526_02640 [candidate division WOR-1 bacterium RIFOXYD2_FULL_36_8]